MSKRRYVLENGNFGAEMEHFLYGYYSGNAETNATWNDQLKTMNGGTVKYDKAGNSTYLLGRTYEWRGRRLIKAYDVEMEYDAAGLRTKKGNTVYFWQGDRLVREKTGEEEIYYYYDESGVSGINYNGKEYYFRKNMLGDVIAIYASNGALQCRYAYSAWGGHEIYDASGNKITGGDNIGIKNPIRYRGYYYDRELYLYYLQSRYYEPILGRFLSPDSPQYLDPTTIQGLNLYTYCLNNPISYADPSGSVAILTAALIGLIVGAIVGTVIGAVVAGVVSYDSGARGWELAGDILFGAFLGSIIGGIAGLLIGAGLGGMSAGATVIGAAIKGGSALSLVFGGTVSTGAAVAIGSTQMLLGGVIAIGGIAVGAMEFNVLFSKDPYVKSLDRKLNKEEQEEFQREIEDWKKGEGRGGNDNLPKKVILEIFKMLFGDR